MTLFKLHGLCSIDCPDDRDSWTVRNAEKLSWYISNASSDIYLKGLNTRSPHFNLCIILTNCALLRRLLHDSHYSWTICFQTLLKLRHVSAVLLSVENEDARQFDCASSAKSVRFCRYSMQKKKKKLKYSFITMTSVATETRGPRNSMRYIHKTGLLCIHLSNHARSSTLYSIYANRMQNFPCVSLEGIFDVSEELFCAHLSMFQVEPKTTAVNGVWVLSRRWGKFHLPNCWNCIL